MNPKKKHITLVSNDKADFDKQCTKFINENEDNIITAEYGFSCFPVMMQPEKLNIPDLAFKPQQPQIATVMMFSAFYVISEAVPATNLTIQA